MLDASKRIAFLKQHCWIWTRAKFSNGYGHVRFNNKDSGVHRHVFENYYGELLKNILLHHECGNKACFNPWHLRQMSKRAHQIIDNRVIKERVSRTHCPSGHEYTAGNILWSKKHQRNCRECNRIECSRRYDKIRKGPVKPLCWTQAKGAPI